MMNSKNNYKDYLRMAKQLYRQEKSFPEVYRHLIRKIDPDIAMNILEELKASNIQMEKRFQRIG